MNDEERTRAINAFHTALHMAYQAWPDSHPGEPWPGYFNMSPEIRAELGIPEAESAITTSLEADFAAWDHEAEP